MKINPNNYIPLEANKFIEIIEGKDENYNRPQRANPRSSLEVMNKSLEASGKETFCTIYLPNSDLRQEGWRLQSAYRYSYEEGKRPDPSQPFVYKLKTPVYWHRGANFSTGEGPQPKLTCGIDLLNCEFFETFSVHKVESFKEIIISSCNFLVKENANLEHYASFTILDSIFKKISLNNNKSYKEGEEVKFGKIEIIDLVADELTIAGMKIDSLTIKGNGCSIKTITIINCEISTIYIGDLEVERFTISGTTVQNVLTLNGKIQFFSLVGASPLVNKVFSVSKISLILTEQSKKQEYFVRGIDLDSLQISGVNNGKVIISDNGIKKINIEYLTNVGDFKLHNVRNVNFFSIKESSLGKAQLSNVDLSLATYVELTESNLIDIILMNTFFPKHLIGSSEKDYSSIREAFRQLKFVSGKQGNRIGELAYEALEMRAYHKDKNANKTIDEKVILFLNWVTNNHGQSWSKAFFLLLILTIPAFIILKHVLGYEYFCIACISDTVYQYLEFSFNPIHDFNKLFSEEISSKTGSLGWARVIDFVGKVLGGLLLFQLFRAFRKYYK